MKLITAFFTCLFISMPVIAKGKPPLSLTLDNYSYPYPTQILSLQTQQQPLNMAFMDVQPKTPNGHAVVLLHGKNFNGAYWRSTIKSLSEEGYRVIVPDQIGFGKSSKPAHYQYSFQQLAVNTKNLLEHLKIKKASILGHSMGGMLATRFALMYPQFTQQLILLNPIGLEDYQQWVPYQTVDKWYQNELNKNADKIKGYQKKNYYDGHWKAEYDEWVELLAGWTKNPDYPLIAWNAALTYDMIFTQPVVQDFAKIKSPTLLIIGTRDRTALGKNLVDDKTQKKMGLYQNLGKQTQKSIPNAKLVELDNVGHLPHIEAFDRFIGPLISFLDGSKAPTE